MTIEIVLSAIAIIITIATSLFSLAAAVIAWLVRKNEKLQDLALSNLQTDVATVAAEVDKVKECIAKYESHVGVGDERLHGIEKALTTHVEREEQIFWKKVEAISDAQRISNEAILQRIAAMEAKMPNGELKDLVKAVARIEASLLLAMEKVDKAERHVEEHNRDAETWKHRIVALESR
jgi:peptidoglycan hydrolase CwlO-like protein